MTEGDWGVVSREDVAEFENILVGTWAWESVGEELNQEEEQL